MKRLKRNGLIGLMLVMVAATLVACASFSTNAFRTEQVTVDAAFTAYVGWTNYLATSVAAHGVTPALLEQSNAVKQARLRFAATASTANQLISELETNAAVQTQVQAALTTLSDQKSNILWLVNFYQGK